MLSKDTQIDEENTGWNVEYETEEDRALATSLRSGTVRKKLDSLPNIQRPQAKTQTKKRSKFLSSTFIENEEEDTSDFFAVEGKEVTAN